MAVLGKIRQRSLMLIGIIGFALFAFIAEELFRSCESHRNEASQRVGEVLGEKLDVQTFNQLVEEYTNVMKVVQQRNDFTADELSQIRDAVWQNFVKQLVLENECTKLGLAVTDKEMQNVLAEGTNPMLMQTPFRNQQTGKFDVNLLKEFLANYKKAQTTNPETAEQMRPMYNYWQFLEKNLRQQLLQQKYEALISGCMLSNEISEKAQFDAENVENTIQLAAFPYASVNDKDVKVEDADLKAKYEELKEGFRRYDETRNIQYVDVKVEASSADINAINKDFADYKAQLEGDGDVASIVRKAGSTVAYNGLAKKKEFYPNDIAALFDSTAVGATTAVKENKADNTLNVVKILSKVQLPDSVEYRLIGIADADTAKLAARADSVKKALQEGADFETIAKRYGQKGEKAWLTSAQYQTAPSMDQDTKAYIDAIVKGEVNAVQNLKLTSQNIIIQVTDKKGMTDMYDAAVIKKEIVYSTDTHTKKFNTFSEFVAKSKNLDDLKANAKKYGFEVKSYPELTTGIHNIAGIRSTNDAIRWIFNEDTNEGDMSQLYECGDNGDHFLVIVLEKINKVGYADLEDANVKNYIQTLALNDKKAEKLMEKAAKCKSVADAQKAGAKVSEVKQVTFASPTFLPEVGAQEAALSGAVSATAKGKFCKAPVKGNAGVYLFQVTEKKTLSGKMDKKAMAQKIQQQSLMAAQGYMQELVQNANVKDNRYIFF